MIQKMLALIAVIWFSIACEKEEEKKPIIEIPSTGVPTQAQNLLAKGVFQSNVHTTSGEAKIYQDSSRNRLLLLKNFRTDSGPDLHIYMAEDLALTNFIEVTDMVNINGTYSVALPDEINLSKHKYVIIWCKRFAVLFGNAELKQN